MYVHMQTHTHKSKLKKNLKHLNGLGIVMHTYGPNTQETQAGELQQIRGQIGLHNEF